MKFPSPWVFGLIIAVACISRSAVAEERTARAEAMTISVTVDPTCTVDVDAGAGDPDEAINVACRNFRKGQPQPLLLDAPLRDGHEVVLIRF